MIGICTNIQLTAGQIHKHLTSEHEVDAFIAAVVLPRRSAGVSVAPALLGGMTASINILTPSQPDNASGRAIASMRWL